MDQIFNTLVNAGGLGVLAVVLLYLHIKGREETRLLIETFSTEQRELMKAFHEEVETVRGRADSRSDRMAEKVSQAMLQIGADRSQQLNRIEAKFDRMWRKEERGRKPGERAEPES